LPFALHISAVYVDEFLLYVFTVFVSKSGDIFVFVYVFVLKSICQEKDREIICSYTDTYTDIYTHPYKKSV
jgi:hypothetical protein